jgi:hypothetical protein
MLPWMTNVVALEREDSVGIDFDPVDNAVDYRVYPLPSDGDITANSDGSVTVKNAIYRCAGLRQTNDVPNGIQNNLTSPDAGQAYINNQYSWAVSVPDTPTLGYVYVDPGSGLVPVYAVGINPTAPEVGWREARPKVYTTDSTVRQTLLGSGGRDDGIVFYVPSAASSSTQTIYHSEGAVPVQNWIQYTEYYFLAADQSMRAMDKTPPSPAFQVLTAAADGTQPLMAVFYQPPQQHVELAVGKERFTRAANQGPGPLWHLEWAGLTQPTTLVVEALSSGCPFQGFLSPQHLQDTTAGVNGAVHQTFFTLAELQSASPTGEGFVNGQYDLPGSIPGMTPLLPTPNASPIPIARAFVTVTPQPHDPSAWDWYQGFGSPDTATPEAWASCTASTCERFTSTAFDITGWALDNPNNTTIFTFGNMLGQFWDAFDDTAQDVTGRVRFSAHTQANIASDATKFLHVTWSVSTVGTDRRYPQLIVTDQPIPVEDGFANANGNFLLVQTIEGPSMRLEVEAFHGLVNGKPWAVNNQAPDHALIDYDNWNGGMNSNATIPPAQPPFEQAGMDRMTKYDAYISSDVLYVFMNDTPAGCTQYPAGGFALSGSVTVTFGDVLYHEGAPDEEVCDQPRPYPFMHEHQCNETKRHWDDLGFKSGINAPVWDTTKFPCATF